MATIKKPMMLKTPIAKAAKKPEKDVAPGPGMKTLRPAAIATPGRRVAKTASAKPIKKGMEALGKAGAKIGSSLMGKK
jgi:hypothetical protein